VSLRIEEGVATFEQLFTPEKFCAEEGKDGKGETSVDVKDAELESIETAVQRPLEGAACTSMIQPDRPQARRLCFRPLHTSRAPKTGNAPG